MKTIFFDLETTDLNFVGQILNYAFVVVDNNWEIVDQLTGKIKVSRTQLPSPYAILANRVDIIEHQNTVDDEEPLAMAKIKQWLTDVIESQKVPTKLIGFNSMKFDVPFLRTSMIRNGVNPYHYNMKCTDLCHVAQKLATVNESFRERLGPGQSLKLENLLKVENLLEGSQEHESLSDVLLTIDLAKHYATYYGIDVRTYRQYEPWRYQNGETVVIKVSPVKDKLCHNENFYVAKPRARMVALDVDKKYALWIDIDSWADGERRGAISWYAQEYSPFFVDGKDKSEEARVLAAKARESLSDISLLNFFPLRNCDIEQFIYMMKFAELDALYDAIWRNDLSTIKQLGGKYSSQLYLRYVANYGDLSKKSTQTILQNHLLYRYGGKLKINKMDNTTEYVEGVYNESFHATYGEMLAQTKNLLLEKEDIEDRRLLEKLIKYYKSSAVQKFAGDALEKLPQRVCL